MWQDYISSLISVKPRYKIAYSKPIPRDRGERIHREDFETVEGISKVDLLIQGARTTLTDFLLYHFPNFGGFSPYQANIDDTPTASEVIAKLFKTPTEPNKPPLSAVSKITIVGYDSQECSCVLYATLQQDLQGANHTSHFCFHTVFFGPHQKDIPELELVPSDASHLVDCYLEFQGIPVYKDTKIRAYATTSQGYQLTTVFLQNQHVG